jgi:hypothetical protein
MLPLQEREASLIAGKRVELAQRISNFSLTLRHVHSVLHSSHSSAITTRKGCNSGKCRAAQCREKTIDEKQLDHLKNASTAFGTVWACQRPFRAAELILQPKHHSTMVRDLILIGSHPSMDALHDLYAETLIPLDSPAQA